MSDKAVERIEPILRVHNMTVALRYYVDVLGFKNAEWGNNEFTFVSRDGHGIYLTTDEQGAGRAWVWMGVDDTRRLHQEYKTRGAMIRQPPTNRAWALEMQVEDPDGNVLRIGSEPEREPA